MDALERRHLAEPRARALRQRRLTGTERHRAILEAAARVFARRGYNSARIQDIARTAGVSKALIYLHFRGKRELYSAIMRKATASSLGRLVQATASEEDIFLRIGRAVGATLDFAAEYPTLWRVMAMPVSDPEILALDRSHRGRVEGAIAQVLVGDEAIAGQDLPPEHLALLAAMINAASVRAAEWWLDHPQVPRKDVFMLLIRSLWLGVDGTRQPRRAATSA